MVAGRVSSASVLSHTSCRKWGAENEFVFTRAGSSKAASVGEEEDELIVFVRSLRILKTLSQYLEASKVLPS